MPKGITIDSRDFQEMAEDSITGEKQGKMGSLTQKFL